MAAKIARSKACVMKWRQKEKKLRRAVRGAEADFYITLASTSKGNRPTPRIFQAGPQHTKAKLNPLHFLEALGLKSWTMSSECTTRIDRVERCLILILDRWVIPRASSGGQQAIFCLFSV
jgi:hypothetical protein